MNNELESIISKNLKSKQTLDLAISYADAVQCLSSEDRKMAIYSLLDNQGLSHLVDSLINVSQSINDIDGELSDMIEGTSHE